MHAFAAPDLSSFINRKGYYAVVVLAACKANLEFVFFFLRSILGPLTTWWLFKAVKVDEFYLVLL